MYEPGSESAGEPVPGGAADDAGLDEAGPDGWWLVDPFEEEYAEPTAERLLEVACGREASSGLISTLERIDVDQLSADDAVTVLQQMQRAAAWLAGGLTRAAKPAAKGSSATASIPRRGSRSASQPSQGSMPASRRRAPSRIAPSSASGSPKTIVNPKDARQVCRLSVRASSDSGVDKRDGSRSQGTRVRSPITGTARNANATPAGRNSQPRPMQMARVSMGAKMPPGTPLE